MQHHYNPHVLANLIKQEIYLVQQQIAEEHVQIDREIEEWKPVFDSVVKDAESVLSRYKQDIQIAESAYDSMMGLYNESWLNRLFMKKPNPPTMSDDKRDKVLDSLQNKIDNDNYVSCKNGVRLAHAPLRDSWMMFSKTNQSILCQLIEDEYIVCVTSNTKLKLREYNELHKELYNLLHSIDLKAKTIVMENEHIERLKLLTLKGESA